MFSIITRSNDFSVFSYFDVVDAIFKVLNVKILPEGVEIFDFLFISKLFLNFQSKYNFQSDLSYDLKQKSYAQRPPSYTRGRHSGVAPHLQF